MIRLPRKGSNYIIYESTILNPVFSNIGNPSLTSAIPQVTRILREIEGLEKKIKQEHTTSEISFQNTQLYAINTKKYCVVLFYPPEQKERSSFRKGINRLTAKIVEC